MPSYTSFCWSLGTTSFRTREFNKKIEWQLQLLEEFWALPENAGQLWSGNDVLRTRYYDFMKAKNFLYGDAQNKPKDAREKTSGLRDIGLIDDERRLTKAGKALLKISQQQAFASDNQLRISNDSYIYLKQLCKSAIAIDGGFVRPYLVTAHVLSKVGALSNDEFTFLLPLITNADKLARIETELIAVRKGLQTVDNIITEILMEMPNYKEALNLFLCRPVTPSLIVDIVMNRKSEDYALPYFDLYTALKKIVFEQKDENVGALYNAVNEISGKPKSFWKQLLFKKTSAMNIKKRGLAAVKRSAPIFGVQTKDEFKTEFFKLLHLYKAKSTLADYFDLNRRYLKTTDTITFRSGMVDFDIIPKCYFALIADKILPVAFLDTSNLYDNCDFNEIVPHSAVADSELFAQIEKSYGLSVRNIYDVKSFVEEQRIKRFNDMIDRNFTNDVLIDLLSKFEKREDEGIQKIVTSNADIPTIFEYIIGIIWYNISQRKVNILDALNLSLDADLLPKSHAVGGSEDLTFKYDKTSAYPEHTLLLEVTLSSSTNQRRMEMEPVSRHLGEYMLKNKDEQVHCVFVSTFLHINVIGDFRGRKNTPYYNSAGTDFVEGMKIIPCQTSELIKIIDKNITYSNLYGLFEVAFHSTDTPNIWYEKNIAKPLA